MEAGSLNRKILCLLVASLPKFFHLSGIELTFHLLTSFYVLDHINGRVMAPIEAELTNEAYLASIPFA